MNKKSNNKPLGPTVHKAPVCHETRHSDAPPNGNYTVTLVTHTASRTFTVSDAASHHAALADAIYQNFGQLCSLDGADAIVIGPCQDPSCNCGGLQRTLFFAFDAKVLGTGGGGTNRFGRAAPSAANDSRVLRLCEKIFCNSRAPRS